MPADSPITVAVLESKLQGHEQLTGARLDNLRQIMESKFGQIEEQLNQLERALSKLGAEAVTKMSYHEQVQNLSKVQSRLDLCETQLGKYELLFRLSSIAWTIGSGVLIAVLIALATGRATIVWH